MKRFPQSSFQGPENMMSFPLPSFRSHKKQHAGLKSPAYSLATRHSPFTGLLPKSPLRL